MFDRKLGIPLAVLSIEIGEARGKEVFGCVPSLVSGDH